MLRRWQIEPSYIWHAHITSTTWWVSLLVDQSSPRGHISKFYVWLQLIRSVLRASKFSVLKFIPIVIFRIYYMASIFGFSFFWYFCGISFQFLSYFVWLRITHEGSVPEMRIWSILLMKFDLKWWSLFIFQPLHSVSVSAVDQRVPESTCS